LILWLLGLLLALWLVAAPFLALWNLLRLRELERRIARIEAALWGAAAAGARTEGPRPTASKRPPAAASGPVARGMGRAPEARPGDGNGVEELEARIAGRWLVWAGGVALALAGLFAAALAFESGLFGPAARLSLLALAGTAIFLFALWLARHEGGPVPRMMAAAGLVTVHAVLFAAVRLYDLLDPRLAFALAVLATGAAVAGTRMLGAGILPLAALGAWAAPLLVGIGAMPPLLLAGYLALVQLLFGTLARIAPSRTVAWLLSAVGLAWSGGLAVEAFGRALAGLRLPAEPAELPAVLARMLADVVATGGLETGSALLLFAALAGRADLPALLRGPRPAPRALRLPFHLHQAVLLSGLLAGWMLRGGDVAAFAAASTFLAGGLLAAARGAGIAAAAIASALPVLLPLLPALPATPPGEVAPGLPAPLPEEVWPVLLQPGLLALAGAGWAGVQAVHGRNPGPWSVLAVSIPLATLATLQLVLHPVLGTLPFALAALTLAAAGVAETRLALAADRRELAAACALQTVAALALGALFHFHLREWPVALAVIAFAALVLHARLPVAALADGAAVLAVLAALTGVNGLFHGEAAGTLDHALLVGLLPLLVLVLVSRTGLVRAHPLRAASVDFARDLLAMALFAQLVAVTNGIALAAPVDPVLREGVRLAVLLRLSLALVGLRGIVPGRVRELWVVPLLAAVFPALALAVGGAAPHLHPWDVGVLPLFDALLVGWAVPAGLAAALALRLRAVRPGAARVPGVAAIAWLLGWEVLEVRHLVHGPILVGPWSQGGHLAVSLCWLATAGALFAAGLRGDVRDLRIAGVGVATLVAAKLFFVDLSELSGSYRVAALFAVGAGLLALGWFERRRSG